MARGKNAGNKDQGSNWCSKKKRAAIYARDGHRCVWCPSTENLTIDHLEPRSRGGDNSYLNLVTACMRCNRLKGDMGALAFAVLMAANEAPLTLLLRVYQQTELQVAA